MTRSVCDCKGAPGSSRSDVQISAAAGWYSSFMSGLERRKSAVERLQTIGMLQTTVIRSSALPSDAELTVLDFPRAHG